MTAPAVQQRLSRGSTVRAGSRWQWPSVGEAGTSPTLRESNIPQRKFLLAFHNAPPPPCSLSTPAERSGHQDPRGTCSWNRDPPLQTHTWTWIKRHFNIIGFNLFPAPFELYLLLRFLLLLLLSLFFPLKKFSPWLFAHFLSRPERALISRYNTNDPKERKQNVDDARMRRHFHNFYRSPTAFPL